MKFRLISTNQLITERKIVIFAKSIILVVMNSVTNNNLIPIIQGYFATQPIIKAWLFGSYSRGEETPGSDVDILVSFDKTKKIVCLSMLISFVNLKSC